MIDYDATAKEASTLTANNDHTQARIVIAKAFGWIDLADALERVAGLHTYYECLTPELSTMRRELTDKLMRFIEDTEGHTIRDMMYAAL